MTEGLKNISTGTDLATLEQKFFCDPVILELICYRTRANRLMNEGNTTGGLRKI